MADKLGKFAHEIEDSLTPDELAEYLAYYTIKAEEEKKATEKSKTRKRPKRQR